MNRFTRLITPFALTFALATGSALAAGSDSTPDKPLDPNYTRAKQMIDDGQYAGAIPLLEQVVASDKENADAFNLLGYSNRQLKNNDVALSHYEAALKLKPKHRGANEYLGELYLTLGDLAKAEERLDVLDGACFFGCEEYTELKNAIAAYKAKAGS
ncbi:tetratricopeptide repeat protein [Pelagibius litoralis]|uniref:Tetratricopeptide repeat protein n=1 Tax=Pelagibius litoralis TaxID=374515 RepID=A0A967F247_9PROT|nr:tetratricopeptide repeat protein [Pelagibius litoralis]NIA71526.1 tetratricopeptide repeat protein [Pelagibius litoralis]